MSRKPTITAERVRELLQSRGDDVERASEISSRAPRDRAAVTALAEGLTGYQWRVVAGCARALAEVGDGAQEASAALLQALRHHEPIVRGDAAESLACLGQNLPLPVTPLWQAYLGEDSTLAALALGEAVLASLRKPRGEVPENLASTLKSMLERVLGGQLTHFPLGGRSAERLAPPSPPQASFLDRLMGRVARAEPPARRVPEDEREFLCYEGDRWMDYPGVISQMAALYAAAAGDPAAGLPLVFQLIDMPLAHVETTHALVRVALGMCRTASDERSLIEALPDWKATAHTPRWRMLAYGLAQVKPEWTAELYLRSAGTPLGAEISNWSYDLSRHPSPAALGPILSAMELADDRELHELVKLVDKVSVDSLLDGWIRALCSQDPELVKVAVEKCLKDGKSLANLTSELEALQLRWSDQPTLTGPLGQLLGLARAGMGPTSPLPTGLRQADVVAEVMLEELPPSDNRKCGDAYVLGDGRMYVRVHQQLFQLAVGGQTPTAWCLPRNAYLDWTFLGLGGVTDEILFGLNWGNFTLFSLRPGQPNLFQFRPAVSDDDAPDSVLETDGRCYGWRGTAWKMSHFEDDPGHHKPFAYIADPLPLEISAVDFDSYPSMRSLPDARISTSPQKCPEIIFVYQSDGAYRVCHELGLAISSCQEGVPVRAFGCGDSELALQVEIFASKLCRVYFWEARR